MLTIFEIFHDLNGYDDIHMFLTSPKLKNKILISKTPMFDVITV